MACFMGSQQTEQVAGEWDQSAGYEGRDRRAYGWRDGCGPDNKAPWLKATWELQSRGTGGTMPWTFSTHPLV